LLRQQSTLPETLQAMRRAALEANDPCALWEHEGLYAVLEVLLGDFHASLSRLEKLQAEMRNHSEGAAPRFQIHQKTGVAVQLAVLLWLMGKPGRAVRATEEAAQEAMAVGHGLTLIHCLSRGIIFVMNECHHYSRARSYTETLKRAIDRHGMAAWIPIADCYSKAIDALSGDVSSPEALRAARDDLQQAPVQSRNSLGCFATVAKAMIAIGQVEDAARTIDHVLQVDPQRWVLPELLRLRAATERAWGHDGDAETTLRDSLRLADEVGLLAWKLRSALDLAVLLKDRGAAAEARLILAPVYDQFTDGFGSGDLRRSRRLLKQLG